ncbi:MAG: hypothetical protein L3J12_02335 [Spirochaetales bacterium]|nr:hypothetical protein [Spirochaetales bacterium]
MKKSTKVKEKQIQFKIHRIRKLGFSENDPSLLGLGDSEIKEAQIDMGFSFRVDVETEILSLLMNAGFYILDQGKRKNLFSINTEYTFIILNFKETFDYTKEKRIELPDPLMYILLNLTIAGTRGMIAALISTEGYKHLILPPIDVKDVLETIKRAGSGQQIA